MLVTAFASGPQHAANGTKSDLRTKITCTMGLSPNARFHARREALSGHVQWYPFLFHSADSPPSRVGEVEVE